MMIASVLGTDSGLELAYAVCALVGGLTFLLRLLLLVLGGVHGETIGGGDSAADGVVGHDVSGEADVSFTLFSSQGITGFFMMFGLVGLGMINLSGVAAAWSVAAALAAGFLTLWVVKWGFTAMLRLQASGTFGAEAALGQEGTVYLNIPAGGTGKVQVAVREHLREYEALGADGQGALPTGTRIKVTGVHSGRLLIVARKED